MRQPVRDRLIDPEILRRSRQEAGLSLSEAASRSGVARWRIQRIETGLAQPTFSDVLFLCAACGCGIEKLLDEDGCELLRSVLPVARSGGRADLKELIEKDSQARERVIDICWWYYRMRQSLNGLEIPELNNAGADELQRHVAHAAGMDASVRARLEELLKLHTERR